MEPSLEKTAHYASKYNGSENILDWVMKRIRPSVLSLRQGGIHMSMVKKDTIEAKGFAIQIYTEDFKNDYISLTDIARYKSDEPSDVIKNWMRRKDTIEFLGLWESLNNMNFNSVEFLNNKKSAVLLRVN